MHITSIKGTRDIHFKQAAHYEQGSSTEGPKDGR